eukprot:GILI01006590.1.p1 GENE.GILI01006590.1~~GILI01006590.1.p1  ORF type:complete len:367 (-),score=106.71 GILI01006590.1:537-1637(-)
MATDPLATTMLERELTIADIMNLDSPAHSNVNSAQPSGPTTPVKKPMLPLQEPEPLEETADEGALKHYFVTRHPHRHCNAEELLAYNRKWSSYMNENDPSYFKELAKHQAPKFLWVGCADSRVPANEILGLAPGDVFVHRNVANVVYPSDLNCLSCVQFGVEQLKIEHLIVCGHYECGGVKAAYYDLNLGLVDNWVASIRDIKTRYWKLIEQVPEDQRVATLCEINAIVQARNIADSTVVQRWWAAYRREQGIETSFAGLSSQSFRYTTTGAAIAGSPTAPAHHNVSVHGWVYGLADGLIVPLVELKASDDVNEKCDAAIRHCAAKRIASISAAVKEHRKSISVPAKGVACEGGCCKLDLSNNATK